MSDLKNKWRKFSEHLITFSWCDRKTSVGYRTQKHRIRCAGSDRAENILKVMLSAYIRVEFDYFTLMINLTVGFSVLAMSSVLFKL